MKTLLATLLCAALPSITFAADRPEGLAAAEAVAKAAFGTECDMNGMEEVPMAEPDGEGFGHSVYRFSYRASYQSAADPEIQAELYQLFCGSGAYNVRHAFVLKVSDTESPKLVAFATPDLDYVYTDDEMDKLKAEPKVRGFRATGLLVNATYDAEKRTITSHTAWRGIGDAWDSGTWTFINGDFVLTRFEVDPTYGERDPAVPESYVVYEAGK
ncbi:DUF1176 domain-containing protein [Shinella sp.]|uniref:DUF1176 domain-containing protein n=1 Tax=Shinella sp. TaxID=1870904 RepID=UPI003F7277F2